jgi:hypothetical protein
MKDQQSIKGVLKGIAASSGIVIGRAFLVHRGRVMIPKKVIKPPQVATEIKRFKKEDFSRGGKKALLHPGRPSDDAG